MEIGFFIKKFISFFLEPLGMTLLLLGLGIYSLFVKKSALSKLFLSGGATLLLLFSYPPFSNYLVEKLENNYVKYDYSQNVRYIHVLGHGHTTDATQPISSQLSNGGLKRVLEGVILHKNIPNSKLIFTGYKGKTEIANAQMNKRLAIALGVKEADIILNEEAKDTKEEAIFASSLVGESPFLLVTSATHMSRAVLLFNSLGMNPLPAPTDFHKEEFQGYLRAPEAKYLDNSTKAVHEYLGLLWATRNL